MQGSWCHCTPTTPRTCQCRTCSAWRLPIQHVQHPHDDNPDASGKLHGILQQIVAFHIGPMTVTLHRRGQHCTGPTIAQDQVRQKSGNLLLLCKGQVGYLVTCSSSPSTAEERRLQSSAVEWRGVRHEGDRVVQTCGTRSPWRKVQHFGSPIL